MEKDRGVDNLRHGPRHITDGTQCLHETRLLNCAAHRPIYGVSFGTMNINALVISGSDPGAVPGDSTNTLIIWQLWGRNRIDERLKGFALFRRYTTVIGSNCIVANDNRAPAMAMAA